MAWEEDKGTDKNDVPEGHAAPGPVCDPSYARAMGKIWFWNEVRCACSLVCVVTSGLSLLGCVWSMLTYNGNLLPLGICTSIGGILSFLLMCLRGWAGYRTDKAAESANLMSRIANMAVDAKIESREVLKQDEA